MGRKGDGDRKWEVERRNATREQWKKREKVMPFQ